MFKGMHEHYAGKGFNVDQDKGQDEAKDESKGGF